MFGINLVGFDAFQQDGAVYVSPRRILGIDHVDIAYNGEVAYVGMGGGAGRGGQRTATYTRRSSRMSALPLGWERAPLAAIARNHDAKRIPLNKNARDRRRGPYPYYGANGLVDSVNDFIFDGGFALLAEDGGYFDEPERGVAYKATGKFWVNNHAHILEPLDGISADFLVQVLNATDWMPYVSGTTRLKLTQGGIERATVPIPPLPEQSRIVAKLDALSARSKQARAELDRVPEAGRIVDQRAGPVSHVHQP